MEKDYLFYDNLIVQKDTERLLINLFSQRRRVLSTGEYDCITRIKKKRITGEAFTVAENSFLELLREQKQLLPREQIDCINREADKMCCNDRQLEVSSINIDLTYACNFICDYCFQANRNFGSGVVSTEDIDAIEAYLSDFEKKYPISFNGINQITLSGGEPIQASTIDTILYLSEVFHNAEINLKTNGSNLKKYWSKISSLKLNKVQISLDGASKEQVQTRGSDALNRHIIYNDIIEGINLAINAGCEVIVATVVDKASILHLPKLEDLFIKEGWLEKSNLSWLINPVIDFFANNELDISHNSINDIFVMSNYVKENTDVAFNYCSWFDSINYLVRSIRRTTAKPTGLRSSRCSRKDDMKLSFSPNGMVYYCNCVEPQNGIVGNYKLNEFDFERYMQYMGAPVFREEKCKKCIYRYVCGGGCRIHSIARIGKGEPFCGAFAIDEIMSRIGELV